MSAGGRDRRITLLHRSLTRDPATGEEVQSWASYDQVWASKLDLHGNQRFIAAQTRYENSTRFVMLYRSDVLPTDRVQLDGVTYSIQAIAEIGRRVETELTCATVTA